MDSDFKSKIFKAVVIFVLAFSFKGFSEEYLPGLWTCQDINCVGQSGCPNGRNPYLDGCRMNCEGGGWAACEPPDYVGGGGSGRDWVCVYNVCFIFY